MQNKLALDISDEKLREIFEAAQSTLGWKFPPEEIFVEQRDLVKHFHEDSDNDFFFEIVMVIFYSGFRATTVEKKRRDIERLFNDYGEVAEYNESKIQEILNDKRIIRHEDKICKIVNNAKKFREVVRRFGSFRKYLLYFNPDFPESSKNIEKLKKELTTKFDYFGPVTVNHFLTDYGFPVLKPDRMIMRVFHRLGFVNGESEEYYEDAIVVGSAIASATSMPIRYVDSVFVSLGQVGEADICRKESPRCNRCGLKKYCSY